MTAKAALSRPIAISDVPPRGTRVVIDADETARSALAKQLKIPAVKRLTADLAVKPWGRSGLAVTGRLEGKVTQVCVVTVDPFDVDIAEDVNLTFVPEEEMPSEEEIGSEFESDLDAPDVLENGVVDLGTVIAEFLALSLDPYPRKPGAEFSPPEESKVDAPSEGTYRPFAGLENLVRRKDDENK
ncbi:DUF177 domain-containing protein [Flaviflagellibacter deserti]|uniref:DUF177 domain-containing protein n=1 Tax=Flaviflagellibacter deserti TaxID=2267266 RepID=A0ABV9Z0J8_9HYPH